MDGSIISGAPLFTFLFCLPPPPPPPRVCMYPIILVPREKVWLSWEVSVKEASFQLSQPPPPPPPPLVPTTETAAHELREPSILRGASGRRNGNLDDDDGCDTDNSSTVLRLVVSETNARMGFRNEKGFFVHASVDAVEASGVGGATFFSINPSALWGHEQIAGGGGGGGGGGGQTAVWPEQPKGSFFFNLFRLDLFFAFCLHFVYIFFSFQARVGTRQKVKTIPHSLKTKSEL